MARGRETHGLSQISDIFLAKGHKSWRNHDGFQFITAHKLPTDVKAPKLRSEHHNRHLNDCKAFDLRSLYVVSVDTANDLGGST